MKLIISILIIFMCIYFYSSIKENQASQEVMYSIKSIVLGLALTMEAIQLFGLGSKDTNFDFLILLMVIFTINLIDCFVDLAKYRRNKNKGNKIQELEERIEKLEKELSLKELT